MGMMGNADRDRYSSFPKTFGMAKPTGGEIKTG